MEDLVLIKNNKAVCTSLQVAEKFSKRHDVVLRNIEDTISDMDSETAKLWFQKTTYKANGNNKSYPMYNMNRDGFSIIAMGFTGKKATEWKVKYIKAFNTMEEMLKEHNTQLWIDTRQTNKENRLKETDVIKQLADYAKEQGSTHSDRLYVVYTKLAKKIIGGKRDSLTASEINNLTLVENIILQTINADMSIQMHYKEIYKDCKDRIEQFMNIAYLTA